MNAEDLAFKAIQELTSVKYIPSGYDAYAVESVASHEGITDKETINKAIEIVKEKLPIVLNSLKTPVWNELK